MIDFHKLVGKLVYTKPVKLVYKDLESIQIPVLVETVAMGQDVAALIVNGSIVVSLQWAMELEKQT